MLRVARRDAPILPVAGLLPGPLVASQAHATQGQATNDHDPDNDVNVVRVDWRSMDDGDGSLDTAEYRIVFREGVVGSDRRRLGSGS